MLRRAVGIVLILAGVIWVLQGFDVAFAPQSFMTGDRSWALWGALATVVGVGLIWVDLRSG